MNLRRGAVMTSPRGTRWTLVKKFTRGWGGQVWYKFESDKGAVRIMQPYEFSDWTVVSR